MILRELLVSPEILDRQTTRYIHPNIVATCKTLLNEGLQVYYQENTFRVSLRHFSMLKFHIPRLCKGEPRAVTKCYIEIDFEFDPTHDILCQVAALCGELRRYNTRCIFIEYRDLPSQYWDENEMCGPHYYILDPFTQLRNMEIETSGLSSQFSKYLTVKGAKAELNPQLTELQELLRHVRMSCMCEDYLGDSWECIQDGRDLDRVWDETAQHEYEKCCCLNFDRLLQLICRCIDQNDAGNCRMWMDTTWKSLRNKTSLFERRCLQVGERIESSAPYKEMLKRQRQVGM